MFRKPLIVVIVASALILFMRSSWLATPAADGTSATEDALNQDSDADGIAPIQPECRVLAHYMPWFQRETTPNQTLWSHWQWKGHDPNQFLNEITRDIAAKHYPMIEPYDSRDPNVIEYHILSAKLAGVQGFVCNWYGPNSFTDEALKVMFPIAEKLDFKLAICLEEKTFYPPYSNAKNRAGLVSEMKRQLDYVVDSYFDSKAYLRRQSKPLVFLFNHWGESALGANQISPAETEEVLKNFAKPENQFVLLSQLRDKAFLNPETGVFAWCEFGDSKRDFFEALQTAAKDKSVGAVVGMACPGFDDSKVNGWGKGPRKIGRREGKEYDESWGRALSNPCDFIQVVSWNDFQDGTTIEPTREYRFKYLDETEKQIQLLNGRVSDISDNTVGFQIYECRWSIKQLSDELLRASLNKQLNEFVGRIATGKKFDPNFLPNIFDRIERNRK